MLNENETSCGCMRIKQLVRENNPQIRAQTIMIVGVSNIHFDSCGPQCNGMDNHSKRLCLLNLDLQIVNHTIFLTY